MYIDNEILNGFRRLAGGFSEYAKSASYPEVNIYEKDGEYVIRMMLPGVEKDSVEITYENGLVTVKGEVKSAGLEGYDLIRNEKPCGEFSRTFRVNEKINQETIKASFKDGLLFVRMESVPEAAPRKIEIS
jgi:HSP20 family protein